MALSIQLNGFSENLGLAAHNLATNQLKVALSNVAPSNETPAVDVLTANCILGNVTQISNMGNVGNDNVTTNSFGQVNGVASLAIASISISADGGTVGPFRYIYIYDSDSVNSKLITCHDNLQEVTLLQGQVFSAAMDNVDGNLLGVRFV